jgi:YEATS domain-containing protein 4
LVLPLGFGTGIRTRRRPAESRPFVEEPAAFFLAPRTPPSDHLTTWLGSKGDSDRESALWNKKMEFIVVFDRFRWLTDWQDSGSNRPPFAARTMADPVVTQGPATTTITDAGNRLSSTTICLPLVRGSVAWFLGPGKNDFQTHQWTLYLRGANNEDLSNCIEKVVFQLHPSFAQPIRIYNDPPYEVTEKGWGEFDAQITIHWKDPSEKTTMVNQAFLVLYIS